jgi:cellulose biosynthesis protein BcsQ
MALLALACAKGSPGVSTLALALAGLLPWPTLLADLDPAGSDLAVRLPAADGRPLDPDRGLLSLAAAVRRGGVDVASHLQELSGGLPVLVGMSTPEQGGGLAPVWSHLAAVLAAQPGTVVADCGRIGSVPVTLPVLAAADAVVLVARAATDQLAHLRERVRALHEEIRRTTGSSLTLGVVLVAPERTRQAGPDVQRLLDAARLPARVLGVVADDPRGAQILHGQARGAAGRTTLVRSVRALLPSVGALLGPAPVAARAGSEVR